MQDVLQLFPDSYEFSRERFRQNLDTIQQLWPGAALHSHRLAGDEDLTIDWIAADALENKQKLLIFTTGEHGIEGFVGSAVLQFFIDVYLPQIDPRTAGIVLLHAINPWGMQNRRRTNANNVDLNRNFLESADKFGRLENSAYTELEDFLKPEKPVKNLAWRKLTHLLTILGYALRGQQGQLSKAVLLGQYQHPKGTYYGGTGYQEETTTIMGLYEQFVPAYEAILHLDMHTGYGPRYQMSLVNSVHEPKPSEEYIEKFDYPSVVKTDPDEFYAIYGDMIDHFYAWMQQNHPQKHYYANAFEFGTYGDSLWQTIRAMRTSMLDNQLYWWGAQSERIAAQVKRDYLELFYPSETRWREKAIVDAHQALKGILRSEGFIPGT